MALPSTADQIVIRYWLSRNNKLEYEYEIGSQRAMGEFSIESSLETLRDNLEALGHQVVLEKGHWQKVWVPNG